MTVSNNSTSFNTGEISPELYGEVDLKKIDSAATTMRNMFVQYRGGAASRAGLAFVGRTLQSASGNGWLTFSANLTSGQTIVLNGVTWTFVNSGATGNETNIGASLSATLTQLQSDLTASTNTSISSALYNAISGTVLMIRSKATTANGFEYTITGGTSGATPSGVTLAVYPPRDTAFQFSITQGYILEWGDLYLRFKFQGGYVLESTIAITGASNADPCVISITGQPFNNGDWVFGSGIGGMTELNGNTYIVANATSGSFTLLDLNGVPVDSTAFPVYTSGGFFSRIYTVASPYQAIDLPYLKFAESADEMSLTCSNPTTGNEYPQYDLQRLAATDWTLTPSDFDPVIVPPASVSAVANAQAPSTGINATFSYVVTAVDGKGNESVASSTATCNGADIEVEAGTNIITWAAVVGASFYNVYRAPASVNNNAVQIPVPAGSIYGFVGSSYGTQFSDTQTAPNLSFTPPTHQNPFAEGQILAVQITNGGNSLSGVTYAITTANGINFNGYAAISGGTLGAFPITNNGEFYRAGDSIAFDGAGFASGSIDFTTSGNPSNGDTITLNSVVWAFVSSAPAGNETLIAGTTANTLAQLVSDLSASLNPLLTVAAYAVDTTGKILLITYTTPGTAGDAYTLAASAATPSAGTLTGGSGGSAGAYASGTLTFSGNPVLTDYIVLNGVTWTFTAAGGGNSSELHSTLAATLTQLASALNANGNSSLRQATYSASATVLTITFRTTGSGGDAYTLNAGTSPCTTSGTTLTGGTSGVGIPAATLEVGPQTGTYPGVTAYFQERRFYANSLNDPDTFWASQIGIYTNFDFSIPAEATDAITATPWTEQVNGIQWLIPMPGGLIAMTGRRAWQIVGEGSYQLNPQPITPSSTQAQPQAFNGCSPTIQPIVIDYDVLYPESVGNTVRDLSWNYWINIYTGNDLTILSSHLFLYSQLINWAWTRQPNKLLWAFRNDGSMLSLTYLKEQEVYGWARHDTQGFVISMASVTEPPVDALYCITQRFPPYAPQGIYVSERMDNRLWQSVEDTFAVDSAVSNPMVSPETYLYASAPSGAVTFTAGASIFSAGSVNNVIRMAGGIATITSYTSGNVVTGTWNLAATNGPIGLPYASAGNWTIAEPVGTLNAPHLAGMTVVGLADGVPISGITVGPTGLITLPFSASNVKVGLPFTAQLQLPYLNGQGVVQGARKVVPAATFRLAASGTGCQIGTNQPDGAAQNPPQLAPAWTMSSTLNTLQPTGGQSPAGTYTSPSNQAVTQLWTGDIRGITGGAAWNSKGQVAIQQTLPLPLEVLSVAPEALPGDEPDITYKPQQQGGSERQQPRGPGRWQLQNHI